jgi:hypothetical protein
LALRLLFANSRCGSSVVSKDFTTGISNTCSSPGLTCMLLITRAIVIRLPPGEIQVWVRVQASASLVPCLMTYHGTPGERAYLQAHIACSRQTITRRLSCLHSHLNSRYCRPFPGLVTQLFPTTRGGARPRSRLAGKGYRVGTMTIETNAHGLLDCSTMFASLSSQGVWSQYPVGIGRRIGTI